MNNSNSNWGTVLGPLSLDTSTSILIVGSNFSITASGKGNASWGAGGNSGSVQFTNYGWDIALAGSGASTGAELAGLPGVRIGPIRSWRTRMGPS